jgi:hypothetical protein
LVISQAAEKQAGACTWLGECLPPCHVFQPTDILVDLLTIGMLFIDDSGSI